MMELFNIIKYYLLCLAGLLFVLSVSCKKDVKGCTDSTATNYNSKATVNDGSCAYKPFQGPVNLSFEEVSGWSQSGSYVTRSVGTAFMPTKGSYFMDLAPETTNNWYSASAAIYQENVDFSLSHTLIFDYQVSGYGLSEKVAILFTANGTDTLWSKSYSNLPITTVQKLNEVLC